MSAFLGLALAACVNISRGDDPARIDPEARQLLEQVAAKYHGLAHYRDHAELTLTANVNGKPVRRTSPMRVTFSRPDKIAIDAGAASLVSDGELLTTVIRPTKKFVRVLAPKAITLPALSEGSVGAELFGDQSATAATLVPRLLLDEHALKEILTGVTQLDRPEALVENGRSRSALTLARRALPSLRVIIDPAAKLIERVELSPAASASEAALPDEIKLDRLSLVWSSGEVTTQPIAAAEFAFQAPAGFAELKPAEAPQPAAARGNKREHALIGAPAPDFTLKVIDSGPKLAALSKADLRGKVVVLDFWATWCPPCRAELPEIQTLADALTKQKKNVVIVAVSQDAEPEDGSTARKLVETTLEELEVKLPSPLAKIALDPEGDLGAAFSVTGLPTLFVLDENGVVQAVHVGYREGIADRLAEQINKLLAGEKLFETPNPAGADEKGR